ncbi:MAG: cache domain-containing protein [Rhodospirillum sp.]|nr:cache domain-containing protein [Rhodospirillum sp.]MCF8500583.1 cache domain-containing protein [Rhodospirillum sp.]
MTLKQKMILLAIVPLVLSMASVTGMVIMKSKALVNAEVGALERHALTAKKEELKNYMALALTAIGHIYQDAGPDDITAKDQVRKVLNGLRYGQDGYFFVYDKAGVNIVHPEQAFRVGRSWLDLKDVNGVPVVKPMLDNALAGGGFHRYAWEVPTTRKIAEKMSYSVMLDHWGWMLGTGIYIDDVLKESDRIREDISVNILETAVGMAVITFAGILMVFVSGVVVNLGERRLADRKLKDLTRRIVEFQEEERARVSRELHDSISQILVSVKYALELAMDRVREGAGDALVPLEKGQESLRQAINEVRRISRDLRPSLLDDLGLSQALQSLAREFGDRTGLRMTIRVAEDRDTLSREAQTTLYRVAQEALTNIERHAQARRVTLHLRHDREGVHLRVEDDGRGFDAAEISDRTRPGQGIGLRNMAERMQFHDGSLQVISSPGGGTKVRASLPPTNRVLDRGEPPSNRETHRET